MIFVFGSNLAGRHGIGAAKHAREYYGAEYGVGEGLTGNAYAIPTKDENLVSRSPREVRESIQRFVEFARDRQDLMFLLTPVGCGLAGFDPYDIAKEFRFAEVPGNVVLHHRWLEHF